MIENLTFNYNEELIIDDFTLELTLPITSLIGPSGCGKSTLVKYIINNVDSNPYYNDISYLSQKNLLLNWKTVDENLKMVVSLQKTNIDYLQYLDLFNLNSYKNSFISELSIGTQKRVALLRSFIMKGNLIILDEPFNGIDEINKIEIIEFMIKLQKKFNKKILLITHNINEAIDVSDQIITLTDKPMTIKKTYNKIDFHYNTILNDLKKENR